MITPVVVSILNLDLCVSTCLCGVPICLCGVPNMHRIEQKCSTWYLYFYWSCTRLQNVGTGMGDPCSVLIFVFVLEFHVLVSQCVLEPSIVVLECIWRKALGRASNNSQRNM